MKSKYPNKDFTVNKVANVQKNNLKPLIFTFLGTFIVFFFAFTVLLPIFSPQVDVPALSDEHSMSSVTSNDFKGRIDPRLSEIEQQESEPAPKLKMESPDKTAQEPEDQAAFESQSPDVIHSTDEIKEPSNTTPDEENYNYNLDTRTPDNSSRTNTVQKSITKNIKPNTLANIPPRPSSSSQYKLETAKPVSVAKVVLGNYATPMQARLVSDTLIEMDLNVSPFIKEKNGKYTIQVGSFSDPSKAEGLVQELKNKGFEAKAVYE